MMPRLPSALNGLERVVVELAAVVDAAHPGPQEEVLVGQDLVPQVRDRLHLGEEPVATDVEAPAVALRGLRDAADDVVGLEHGRRPTGLAQLVGRGETGGTRADDDGSRRRALLFSSPIRTPPPRGRRILPGFPSATPRPRDTADMDITCPRCDAAGDRGFLRPVRRLSRANSGPPSAVTAGARPPRSSTSRR